MSPENMLVAGAGRDRNGRRKAGLSDIGMRLAPLDELVHKDTGPGGQPTRKYS